MTTGIFRLAVAAVAFGVAASPLNAAFLASTDRGRLDPSGNTNPSGVYFTGQDAFNTYRSYFAFDVSNLSGDVLSGSFLAFNPLGNDNPGSAGFAGDAAGETLQLREFGETTFTSVADLNSGSGGAFAYADLADGAVFGTATVNVASNGTTVTVTLTAAAITALNDARPQNGGSGTFVFGGGISSISGISEQYVLGSTSGPANDGQTGLDLTLGGPSVATPLPPTLLAGLLGLPLLAGVRRFRRA